MRASDEASAALARYVEVAQTYPRAAGDASSRLEAVVGRAVRHDDGQAPLEAYRVAWTEAMSEAVARALQAGLTKTSLRGHRGAVPRRVLDGLIRERSTDPSWLILKHWPVVVAYRLLVQDLDRLEQAGQAETAADLRTRARPVFRKWAQATAAAPPHDGRLRRAQALRLAYDAHLASARQRVVELIRE